MYKSKAILIIAVITAFQFLFFSCGNTNIDKEKYGNCSDGVKNQNEDDVDCGGYCLPCASCDNARKDQDETGIDCGGTCASCAPPCTITAQSLEFKVHPPDFSFPFSNSNTIYSASYDPGDSQINISFSSGGGMVSMKIYFKENFNPITHIPLNETMVFKTLSGVSSTVYKESIVKITYNGNFGMSSYNGSIETGQTIYLTKVSDTKVLIRFCELKGNVKDELSLDVLAS